MVLERATRFLARVIRQYYAKSEAGSLWLDKTRVNNVLVIELAKIGDLICIIPVLRAIRENCDQARITVLCQESHGGLLDLNDFQLETMKLKGSFKNPLLLLKTVSAIRKENFDLLFVLSPSTIHGILSCLSGIPRRVGYLIPWTSKTPFLYNMPVDSYGVGLKYKAHSVRDNLVERAMKPLSAVGFKPAGVKPALEIAGRMVEEVAQSLGLDKKTFKQLIVMHVLKNGDGREWPLQNYTGLIKEINRTHEAHFILIGSWEDEEYISKIIQDVGDHASAFVNEDIKRVAALMKFSDLFIGCDSGPLHLAAASGCKTIGMFGPAPPEFVAPPECTKIIYKRVECSPCEQGGCIKSSSCMESISPAEVVQRVNEILPTGKGLSRDG